MAQDLRESTVTANAKANAVAALLDGGSLCLYAGSRPLSPDYPVGDQTKLAELRFESPAFAPASGGAIKAYGPLRDESARANGEATWYRAVAADGETAIFDGSVGTGDANLEMKNTIIGINMGVDVHEFVYVVPVD